MMITSCSVTRRFEEGTYMLKRNVVKVDKTAPRKERIAAGQLGRYIQQSTNKHFLGTNLYAWLYAQADPAKDNGGNRFLRRAGEPPVVWSPEKTELSREYLETYVASRGFFSGTADYKVDTLRRKKVKVTYSVRQGEPSFIGNIKYTFLDRELRPVVMADSAATLLRSGDIFDINVMDSERGRITQILKNEGYYDFNTSSVTYIADSVAGSRVIDLTLLVHRQLAGYNADGSARYEAHKKYRIGEIYVRPDYNLLSSSSSLRGRGRGTGSGTLDTLHTRGLNIVFGGEKLIMRPKPLRRAIRLNEGGYYSAAATTLTSEELMRLGAFRSASVAFNPAKNRPDTLPASVGLLDAYIRCVPGMRQTIGFDVEGTFTDDFWGLRPTVSYQNRNIFRGAELFDASITGGFEFLRGKNRARKLSYELGASVSLTFPRLVFWEVDRKRKLRAPTSKLTLSASWQDRVAYTRALFGLNWGYSWGIRRYEKFTVSPFDVSYVRMFTLSEDFRRQLNNPYLVASYDNQLVAGISVAYVYNNQSRDLSGDAIVLRVNAETTGNLFSGLARAFWKPTSEGHYNVMGVRFSQYVRGDVNFSHKIVLGAGTAFVYRVNVGAILSYGNSESPPFDKLFYAGGVNSMRGWAVRTLGPGTQLYKKQRYPAQMGDVKMEVNAELRFPIVRPLAGAMFFDAGNIWFMRSKPAEYPDQAVFRFNRFYRQLGFNTGLGLRVDLRFVVLRLDWGIQLHSPNRPSGERWIYDFKWRNMALNFGVGYPF